MAGNQKTYAWMIFLLGVLIAGFGFVGTVEYLIAGNSAAHPFNLGIILGYGAHMLMGGFAIFIADHLTKIEKRLDRLESGGDLKDDAAAKK